MRLIRLVFCTLVGFALVLITAAEGRAAKSRYEEIEVNSGGSIVGTVRLDGKIPERQALTVRGDDEICHKGVILSDELVVSDKGGIRWAVVSIAKIAKGKPFPDDTAVLDQRGCRFDPHVVLVPERRALKILNNDGILHNVHTHGRLNRSTNVAMSANVKDMEVKFARREKVSVTCDVHAWMKAWIVVIRHPYCVVSDGEGGFRLDDVPPGSYTVEVWHEKLGKQEMTVTVKPGEEARLDFTYRG